MHRRHCLLLAGAALTHGVRPARAQAAAHPLQTAAQRAWLWGLPLVEMAQARHLSLRQAPANTMRLASELATPRSRDVTTPNNDTLYARAWIDLAHGPVTLTLPASGGRYLSVALMDMYSNNFAVLGTRTTGGEGGRFTLLGPQSGGSPGPGVLRSPTRWVWLLARTLVDGASDLAAANAVQAAIQLQAPPAESPAPLAGRAAPWAEYFGTVQQLMNDNPPLATDTAWLRSMAPLGLQPGGRFDATRFSPDDGARIEAGVREARASLSARRPGLVADGWLYPKATLGDFGQDYLYRAQVALGGLAALPPAEAMYLRAVNPQGAVLFAPGSRWRMRFAPGQLPPVHGFWSLSMYEATPEGQFFFTPNAVDRYAVGDRSGLVRGADGSLDLWFTPDDPGESRRDNWLPTPVGKPFSLVLRAYLPQDALLTGSYRLPPLVPA